MCVGVIYSGEYDVCGVTLSVHPHRASFCMLRNTSSKLMSSIPLAVKTIFKILIFLRYVSQAVNKLKKYV